MRAVVFVASLLIAANAPNSARAQDGCTALLSEARAVARGIGVSVMMTANAAIGSPVRVRWTRVAARSTVPGIPVYLVVAAPAEIRFAGDRFIALTPTAKGLEGLKFGRGRARAFVPLHRYRAPPRGGDIAIKFYGAGLHSIEWAVASVGRCGEHILAQGPRATVAIPPGAPELVLQDRFATRQSVRRQRASNNRHDLLVYDGRYEIHDVATGAKIFERPGANPNFSPTGRFVVASSPGERQTEVIDVVSRSVAATFESGEFGWTRGDSVGIFGWDRFGGISLANILVDRPPAEFSATDCRPCSAADVDFFIDVDRGFAARLGNPDAGLLDLFTGKDWKFTTKSYGDQAKQVQRRVLESAIRRSFNPAFRSFPRYWNSAGDSVDMHEIDEGESSSNGVQAEGPPSQDRRSDDPPRAAGDDLVSARLTSRGFARGMTDAALDERSASVAFDHLANAMSATVPPAPLTQIFEEGDGISVSPGHKAVIDEILQAIPDAAATMREPQGICGSDRAETAPLRVLPESISQTYRWTTADGPSWILETTCYAGSGGFLNAHDIVLVNRNASGPAFRSIIRALDEPDDEMGLWVAKRHHARIFRGNDETLVVVAPLSGHAAVIDTKTADRLGAVMKFINADLLLEARRSTDRRHLLQLNTDGAFYVHRVADGVRVLRGAIVDDEVIVSTDDGLYDTTYEGAHSVQIRFAGLPGLFSFHQFELMLRRHGLAKTVLEGADVPPPPTVLPVPPQVRLTLSGVPKDGKRAVKVIATSERRLKEVQLYLDGRLIQTLPVRGVRAEAAATLDDPGGARWVTAVAVDSNGLISLPSAVQIPGAPQPRGTLRAVIVGVDRYSEPALRDLVSAKKDAESFTRALDVSWKKGFASFEPTQLLDHRATPDALRFAVAAAARQTKPDDTLVFFFAGHGIDAAMLGSPDVGLVLAAGQTRLAALSETGILWSSLAEAVATARGKVIVVLDACHSGLADQRALATNDAMVSALFTRGGAPMVVLAASKGRQDSREVPEGGWFTTALVAALTSERATTDRDGSGLVDLGELYAAVKGRVVSGTKGEQTPWLARNGLVGEMSLF